MMKGAIVLLFVSVLFSNFYVFGIRVSQQKCKYYEKIVPAPDQKFNDSAHFADLGEFPFMAKVYAGEGTRNGILISEDFVLSTAATIHISNTGHVIFGTLDEHPVATDPRVQNISIEYSTFHPDFNNETRSNNLRLFKLKTPVVMNKYVRPGCLPLPGPHTSNLFIHIGWGQTNQNDKPLLNKIKISHLKDGPCRDSFVNKGTPQYVEDLASGKVFCADEIPDLNRRELIQDVRGSVLLYEHRQLADFYQIIGMANLRIPYDQGQLLIPTLFLNLSKYIDWIEDTVWLNTTPPPTTIVPPTKDVEFKFNFILIIIPIVLITLHVSSACVVMFKSRNRLNNINALVHSK